MNESWIRAVWERRGFTGKIIWLLLLPASYLYSLVVQLRNALYALGWKRSARLGKPVISVGNLTVGGTGKTPSCIWLAQELTQRGFSVGILSRGYPRQNSAPVIIGLEINGASESEQSATGARAGDEPSMMARLYGQVVGVGKNRYQTALQLLEKQNVDLFILDDGYQHRKLKRDVDILLLGSDSDGWVLPAGPFREPRRALRRADYYLVTGAEEKWRSLLPVGKNGQSFIGALRAVALVEFASNRWKEHPLSVLYRSKLLAISGIANPSGFYRLIHDLDGEIVETLEFPDHHTYTSEDWQKINRLARQIDLIVTTEKDILKLVSFPFAKGKLLALRVAMTVENGDGLIQSIAARIRSKPDHERPE
jgi:tetraacyldisaccharide 4'-kinase